MFLSRLTILLIHNSLFSEREISTVITFLSTRAKFSILQEKVESTTKQFSVGSRRTKVIIVVIIQCLSLCRIIHTVILIHRSLGLSPCKEGEEKQRIQIDAINSQLNRENPPEHSQKKSTCCCARANASRRRREEKSSSGEKKNC